jgi:hypothetical protein
MAASEGPGPAVGARERIGARLPGKPSAGDLGATGWRLIAVATAVSVLLLPMGHALVSLLLPTFAKVFSLARPGFQAFFQLSANGSDEIITAASRTTALFELAPGHALPPLTPVDTVWMELVHALVPAVIFLTGLLAWPLMSRREIFWRIGLGLAGLFLVLCLTTPLYLAGRVEMLLMEAAAEIQGVPPAPFQSPLILWAIFTEMGGRWLLPIVMAIACVSLGRRWSTQARSASATFSAMQSRQ